MIDNRTRSHIRRRTGALQDSSMDHRVLQRFNARRDRNPSILLFPGKLSQTRIEASELLRAEIGVVVVSTKRQTVIDRATAARSSLPLVVPRAVYHRTPGAA